MGQHSQSRTVLSWECDRSNTALRCQILGSRGLRPVPPVERAVPINREICAQVFREANGKAWTWDNGRTELAQIGS